LAKTLYTERQRKLRELLVAKRKEAGLTQPVVAQRLGKPPSYVAKYELGEQRLERLGISRYAAAIGFDPCELIRALLKD
jgi:transcriptional regulator with XRE-family HTH domain